VLRSKVRLRDVTEQYDIWAAWGSDQYLKNQARQWNWARSGVAEPVWDAQGTPWGTKHLEINDARAPGLGRRILTPAGHKGSLI
jgi:transferase CAF17, mitochondrial